MNYNSFQFIEEEWPDLYLIISEVNSNLSTSANIALIKLRQLVESTLKYIDAYEKISSANEKADLKQKLELLNSKNIVPYRIINLMNEIRKIGNKAVHDNYSNSLEANKLYVEVYELLVWFAAKYGKRNYKEYLKALNIYEKVIFQEYLLEFKFPNSSLESPLVTKSKKITSTVSNNTINQPRKKVPGDDEYEEAKRYEVFYYETGDETMWDEALVLYEKAVKKKHILSTLKLIEMEDFEFDADLVYIRKEAVQGNLEAQTLLGALIYYGIDVEEDEDLGFKWLRKAAGKGNPMSDYFLGLVLEENQLDEGGHWILYAANKGLHEAQEYLIDDYQQEYKEIPKNLNEIPWLLTMVQKKVHLGDEDLKDLYELIKVNS